MMEPKEKKAFEPSGLVPRSIVRTFERFRQQLLPGSETAAIREYRISRYQVLVSARCLFTLLTIPIATNWLVSSWLLSPLIEHFWNTQQNEIFLNSYQEERAFAELEFFSEKLFFESLLNNAGFTETINCLPRKELSTKLINTDNSNNLFNSTIELSLAKQPLGSKEDLSLSARFLPPSCKAQCISDAKDALSIPLSFVRGKYDLLEETVGNKQMLNSRSCIKKELSCIPPPGVSKDLLSTKLIELRDLLLLQSELCKKSIESSYLPLQGRQSTSLQLGGEKLIERRQNPGISINFVDNSLVNSSSYSFPNQSWNTPERDKFSLLLSVGKKTKESTALSYAKKLEIEKCDTVPLAKRYEKLINSIDFISLQGKKRDDKKKSSLQSELCNNNKSLPPSYKVSTDAFCFPRSDKYENSRRFLKALFLDLELNFLKPLKETDLYTDSKKNTSEAPTIKPIQLFFQGPSKSKPIHFERKSEGKSINSVRLSLDNSNENKALSINSIDLIPLQGKKRVDKKKSSLQSESINYLQSLSVGALHDNSNSIDFVDNTLKIKEQVQEKILELAVYYNQQTILSITNIIGDLVSLFTLGCLFIWMKPEITILKSFLIEAIYSLSDTTKSFLLILLTDLLVGFHSPRGWETALELLLKHFGLPENQDFVFLFVATFPVLLDTVFKYWIFRHLNKISPSTVATYHSMIE